MFGFDIGTTRSKVAKVDPTGKPSIITNSRGEPTTPSVLYRDRSGHMLVGTDAREQGVVDPRGYAANFKLALGTTQSVLQDGDPFTPTDATAALIAALKGDAENATGTQVEEAVFTCPANFRDDAKQALMEAAERNGIKVQRLVPEPSAAGFAYSHDKGFEKARILVYDFGGGTFDVSVIEIDGDQITVRSTEGVPHLGGNNLDEVLETFVLDAVRKQTAKEPTPQSDPLFFLDVRQRIETAKISLGVQKEVPIVTSFGGAQILVQVKQNEFQKAIDPLVQQSLDALDRAVQAAGLSIDKIDRLIMVGGTSRLPFIQSRVAEHTGIVPHLDIDPEKAIAYGAVLASVSEIAREGRTATLQGQVIPAPDAFVRDCTAHDVGCCVVVDRQSKRRFVNSVIIPKNTPIPCQRSDRFYLEHDEQTAAQIEILQGEAEAQRDNCLLIGELALDDLPREPNRSERIHVEYVIDANGMVTATATDKVSGKSQTVAVDYKRGIKPRPKPKAA